MRTPLCVCGGGGEGGGVGSVGGRLPSPRPCLKSTWVSHRLAGKPFGYHVLSSSTRFFPAQSSHNLKGSSYIGNYYITFYKMTQ